MGLGHFIFFTTTEVATFKFSRILCGSWSFWWSYRLHQPSFWDRPPVVWAPYWTGVKVFFHLVVVSWGFNLAHIEMDHSSFLHHEVFFRDLQFFSSKHWDGVKAVPPAPKKNRSFRFFAKIGEKGRRAWSANTCLSTTTRPQTVNWSDEVNELTMQVYWWCGGSLLKQKCFFVLTWYYHHENEVVRSEWVQTFWRIISN